MQYLYHNLNICIFAKKLHHMAYKAVLAGASGLIGSALLDILLKNAEYDEVIIFVRKELNIDNKKLVQVKTDFHNLNQYSVLINGHAIFCCLGSTRKKTPDLKEYRKIDHDYPLQLAQIGFINGIKQFHLVSALGANASSSNFYIKMKGETEADIKNLCLPALHIYQPSLLIGKRQEMRFSERFFTIIMRVIDPLLLGGLKKYKSIPAKTVAMAMFKQSLINEEGIFIHPSDKIKQLS
jgi:uncharacterized protein YbjT (DUF2867 family)